MPRVEYDDYEDVELTKFGEQIKDDLRAEYRGEQAQRAFWTELYDRYPALRAHRDVVTTVYTESLDELMNMTAGDALETLAANAAERIKWLERTRHDREEAACYVGGPGLEGKPAIEQEFHATASMGSFINGRKAARRAATVRGYRPEAPTEAPTYGRRASR